MQLLLTKKRLDRAACALLGASLLFAGCHKTKSPGTSSVRVSLCELYEHPAAYDGKLITVAATITRLPNGTYLIPLSSKECAYFLIKVAANDIHNDTLSELESLTVPLPARKEFDLELTGTFDAKYSEHDDDYFRYRIVPIEIKPQSPVRTAELKGAA
jgi:hypothetical protein